MNNNLMKLVVFAILFFIFAMAFSYFKSINRPEVKAPAYVTYSDIDQEVQQTPQEKFKDAYIQGCMKADVVTKSVCTCSFNYVEENVGYSGFVKLALDYDKTGIMPKVVTDSFEYCIDK